MKGSLRAMASGAAIAAATTAALLASPVAAQAVGGDVSQTTAATAAPDQQEAAAGDTGDIIVTAQRRSENINKVPLSIQAFSGDKLAAAGVADASGLAQVTTGLNFAKSSANTPIYTLRGIGFNTPNLSSTSPVGLYVDEVAYPYPYMGNGPMFDLERVEVLKGPQGTQYGRNTTGGLVNFITARPSDRLSGGVSAELGNFQTYNFEGFINLPVTETLAVRVSGRWENSDKGWQRSVSRDDRLGEKDRLGLRGLIAFKPSADLSIDLSASYWRDKSDTVATQAVGLNPDSPAFVLPGLASAIKTDWSAGTADWDPAQPGKPAFAVDSRFFGLAGRIKLNISDHMTLVSLTSYNDVKRNDFNDDGVAAEVSAYQSIGRIKSFSQELRLLGDGNGFNYAVGGYYSNDKISDRQVGWLDSSSVIRQLRFVANLVPDPRYTAAQKAVGFRKFFTDTQQTSRSLSVFANGEVELSDTLKLSGGARYSADRLRYSACSRDLNGNTTPVWNTAVPFVISSLTGLPFKPGEVVTNGCLTYRSDFFGVAPFEKPTLSEDNVAGRLALNYEPNSNVLLYGSVSRGFKSGAIPIIAGNVESQFAPATQERVTAFEAGTKLKLADGKVRLNLAGFYMDYKDKQLFGEIPDPVFTSLTRIVNVPKSRIYGGEAEVVISPSRALTINASASYTNTKVTQYLGFNRLGVAEDFAGSEFPYTPKWQLNGGVAYDAPITDDYGLQASVNASYQSKTSSALGNEAGFEIKGYTLVNATIALHQLDNGFRLGLFARNLFNENYYTGSDVLTDITFRVPGMTRTYGITAGYRF